MPTINNTNSMREQYRKQKNRQINIENNFVMKPVHKKCSQTTCLIKKIYGTVRPDINITNNILCG